MKVDELSIRITHDAQKKGHRVRVEIKIEGKEYHIEDDVHDEAPEHNWEFVFEKAKTLLRRMAERGMWTDDVWVVSRDEKSSNG